jgi:hypothetical protein
MLPPDRHLARHMRHAAASEFARDVVHEAATIVVRKPLLEVMQPREIGAITLPTAIAIELDVMQHPLGRPIALRLIHHPRKRQRDLEERPAIHRVHVH